MSYQTNATALLELLQRSQQFSSQGDITWIKFSPGTHKIRLLPAWSDEGIPTRMIVNHDGYKNKEGYQRNPLCYHYAFSNQNIAEALVKKGVVKPSDLEFFGKIGCVFCKISDIIIKTQGKKNNKTFAKAKFLWNVYNYSDNKIYKWSTSKKMFEAISMFASAYPNMFNLADGSDLMLMAQGEGLQRRYNINIIPAIMPLAINLEENPLHDLDQAMADGYRNLNEAIELILNTFPNMLQILGIDPSKIVTNAPF